MRREREGRRGGTKRGQWRGRCSVVRRIQWGTVFWRCIRSMPRASRAAISSVSIPLHPRLPLNLGKRIHHHHHACSWLGLGSSADGDRFDFTCTCREDRLVRGRAVREPGSQRQHGPRSVLPLLSRFLFCYSCSYES